MKKKFLHYAGLFFFLVLVAIAVLATVLPLFHFKQWYFRIFDYPRLQTLVIAIAALAWFLWVYFKKTTQVFFIIVILVVIIVIQAYKAIPYTPLGIQQVKWTEKEATDTTFISLFISNVLQTNTAYGKLVEKINAYKPDLIITTESNKYWQKALSVLEKDYPFNISVPQENTYGMHLFSKLPLAETSVRYLLSNDIPSIRTRVQLRSGEWIHLFIVHPRPPVPGEDKDSKQRDAELIMVAKEGRKEKGAVIVAGDFNDVAWSKTTELFQEVSGFLDPRRGRGFYNTYHAKFPVFRWPLDHVFHSTHFKLETLERVSAVNSDHFPMFIRLSYEPEEKIEQPAVEKEKNTDEKAKETIEEGKKNN